jgi:hypothetical protein
MRLPNNTTSFLKSIGMCSFLMYVIIGSTFAQDQTVTLTTTGQGENLQQATDNALRSAIEQTFGAFISTRTEILNDDLVSDQIASVTGGNIQSYEVLAQTELSETLWGVTVSAVVSVTKLTSFVQARGVQVEIQGGLFAANIRQQQLNEEAEIVAVRNMVGVLHELFQTAFDYEIEVGSPTAIDASNANWSLPVTITVTTNENMAAAVSYFQSTLHALSLTTEQEREYKSLNKNVFEIKIRNDNQPRRSRQSDILLRREESLNLILLITYNLEQYYRKLYVINSGLDRKIGLGLPYTNYDPRTPLTNHSFYYGGLIHFVSTDSRVATFRYDEIRTISEINSLSAYSIQPLGIVSRVIVSEVFNPDTGYTWMDRNIGALWPAVGPSDRGAIGDKFDRVAPIIDPRSVMRFTYPDNPNNNSVFVCPVGYRLPTLEEWQTESYSTDCINDPRQPKYQFSRYYSNDLVPVGCTIGPVIESELKLPIAGITDRGGRLKGSGVAALYYYWSGEGVQMIQFTRGFIEVARPTGNAQSDISLSSAFVRCLKD